MADTKKLRKILWAVDAFAETGDSTERVGEVLKSLTRESGAPIEPVYVLSPYELEIPVEFSPPWVQHYRPAAENSLNQKLSRLKLANVMPGKVLVQSKPSLMSSVRSIAAYAKNEGASMVVIGTHARKGLSRLFLGSFTESLMLYSKVPVLTVNPQVSVPREFRTILYPTDFSDKSRATFKQALSLAKAMDAKVVLHHSVVNPIEPVFQSGVYLLGGGWVPVRAYLDREQENCQRVGDEWIRQAKKAGVQAQLVIDMGSNSVVESINAQAKKHRASIIAMAAQSGRVSSALAGSITREVVRSADTPVWVLRP